MANVLLAGESWISATTEYKGFDSFTSTKLEIGCKEFLAALRSDGHRVTHLCGHDVPEHFPWSKEELNNYDVVILSDIGSNSFLLPPTVFDSSKRIVNRLNLLAQWVGEGHGLMMAGGYLSYSGFEGKAHYHNTAIETVLPVSISPSDDRIEVPQGIHPITEMSHPITNGLGSIPALLGYQRVQADPGSDMLLSIDGDPLLVVGHYLHGRSLAYMSDISPHWAPSEFVTWPGYQTLFSNSVKWLAGEFS